MKAQRIFIEPRAAFNFLLTAAVDQYRLNNPKSRAVNGWTYYGSTGVVKRATCIFCRKVVSTCSAEWPETKTFKKEADEHTINCAFNYLKETNRRRCSRIS